MCVRRRTRQKPTSTTLNRADRCICPHRQRGLPILKVYNWKWQSLRLAPKITLGLRNAKIVALLRVARLFSTVEKPAFYMHSTTRVHAVADPKEVATQKKLRHKVTSFLCTSARIHNQPAACISSFLPQQTCSCQAGTPGM